MAFTEEPTAGRGRGASTEEPTLYSGGSRATEIVTQAKMLC